MTDVIEAVAAATASVARLYEVGKVPASPTYPYGSYAASLGRGDTYLLSADEGVRWGRVTVQAFGKTASSALAKAEEVRAALFGAHLAITGFAATPIRTELDPVVVRDPNDSGVVGVTATYTFTVTKET